MEINKPQYTRAEIVNRLFPIYFYRKHLDLAAKDILGLKLSPHHRIILRGWSRGRNNNLVLSSRGMGKSFLIAIYYILISLLYPKNKTMVIGGSGFRQSKMVLLEIEKIIMGRLIGQGDVAYATASLMDSKKVINKDPSFWSVQFLNGSIVYAVPLGDGQTIRGLRSFVIAQDEAFLLPPQLVQAVLDPMLNVLYDPTKQKEDQIINLQILRTSTIDFTFRSFYKDFMHYKAIIENEDNQVYNNLEIGPDDITVFEFNFEDAFYLNDKNEHITIWGLDWQGLLKKKTDETTDINVWNAENKNIPMDLTDSYFPLQALEACSNVLLDKDKDLYPEIVYSCTAPCVLGIDTAPASANTAFVVVKLGQDFDESNYSNCTNINCDKLKRKKCIYGKNHAIVFAHEENKMSQKDRVKMIYNLMERYNIQAIAMDARGGGYELADLLKDGDYVLNLTGGGNKPIYDPENDPDSKGLPILTLYAVTQDINMIFNAYLKALITNSKLLFPKPLRGRPEDSRLLEPYGHIETLINQLARIRATPAGKGLRFEIESVDPESGRRTSGKKDIYSALVYAVGKMRDIIEERDSRANIKYDLALPIAFNL